MSCLAHNSLDGLARLTTFQREATMLKHLFEAYKTSCVPEDSNEFREGLSTLNTTNGHVLQSRKTTGNTTPTGSLHVQDLCTKG